MVSIQYAVQGQETSSQEDPSSPRPRLLSQFNSSFQTQDKIFLTAYSGPENTLCALSCIQLFNDHKDRRRWVLLVVLFYRNII